MRAALDWRAMCVARDSSQRMGETSRWKRPQTRRLRRTRQPTRDEQEKESERPETRPDVGDAEIPKAIHEREGFREEIRHVEAEIARDRPDILDAHQPPLVAAPAHHDGVRAWVCAEHGICSAILRRVLVKGRRVPCRDDPFFVVLPRLGQRYQEYMRRTKRLIPFVL